MITVESGHVGGVVGFNRRTGKIYRAATGKEWLVYANTQAQDNGTGGIIGYNISEQDIELCDNHATVIKMDGNSVGGMAGRNENGTTNSWRIYDCRNYGDIYAKGRSGGFFGNWKYKGGTLEQCVNYGKVQANENGAGGIVGYIYGVSN